MGREPTCWFPAWLDKAAMNREARSLLERLRVDLPPTKRMKDLSVAQMQTVEIAKALAYQAEVIIMDEPTSAISEREVEALFAVIRDLKSRGRGGDLHFTQGWRRYSGIADVVTVLRDGRHVATLPIGDLDENKLIALMVGRELSFTPSRAAAQTGSAALEARGLSKAGRFHDVSFSVRRGEILGIAGLMGAGRTDLVSAVSGLAPAEKGEVLVARPERADPASRRCHRQRHRHGDRGPQGIRPGADDVREAQHYALQSRQVLSRVVHRPPKRERRSRRADPPASRSRPPDRSRQVKYLSGGNQQKVLISKALLTDPAVLILDEPTRGIDIGAKVEIYAIMKRLTGQGKAIIMVSSEMEEILSLSDRILVMREGGITAELYPQQTTPEEIMKYAMPN